MKQSEHLALTRVTVKHLKDMLSDEDFKKGDDFSQFSLKYKGLSSLLTPYYKL